MKIAIIGTRGIPNKYGGFEQFASYIAPMLARKGHHVFVYNSSTNGYHCSSWRNVQIITKPDPQKIVGSASQFIYDFLCIRDARTRHYDLILQLGYTTSSLWGFLFPKNAIIATNMDGMEWKRSKYNRVSRKFLQMAERWAVKQSTLLIADAEAIRDYYYIHYGREALFIPYGAHPTQEPTLSLLNVYGLKPFGYNLAIARLEPENNLEMIIQGHLEAAILTPLIIIGDYQNAYGRYLRKHYPHPGIVFKGALYDTTLLDNLRYFSNLYFHGHSVGGTNPSLLEAMAARCLVVAHDNIFNREVLGGDAYFFENHIHISTLLGNKPLKCKHRTFLDNNLQKINAFYNWENVLNLIEQHIINRYADRI